MSYRVTVTVPVELSAVASAVGRAMDVDVGGADSFVPVYDAHDSRGKPVGQPTCMQAQTWASEAFALMFQYLIARPEALWQAVAADFEARWPDVPCPDLNAVQGFCASATLEVQGAAVPLDL